MMRRFVRRYRWLAVGAGLVAVSIGVWLWQMFQMPSIKVASEIDLLLEDIKDEPTPDNIDELITRASTSTGHLRWADGSLDPNYLAPNEVAHVARYLRAQFQSESLRERLEYEKTARVRRTKLTASSKARMAADERSDPDPEDYYKYYVPYHEERAAALENLHSDEVVSFINRDGAGFSRYSPPGVEVLRLPEPCPVPIQQIDDLDPGQVVVLPPTEPEYDEFTDEWDPERARVAYEQWRDVYNPNQLLSRPRLTDMHRTYRTDFAVMRNGLVRSLDDVTGFVRHRITKDMTPDVRNAYKLSEYHASHQTDQDQANVSTWRLSRMHLVSLLKFAEPKAYVADALPSMDELSDTRTRALDAFESQALDRLYAGEDIEIASRQNQILMLGSLRATTDCRSCHDVRRGDLLGAFSYELVRVDPSVQQLANLPLNNGSVPPR